MLFRTRSRIRNTLYHYRVANFSQLKDYNYKLFGTKKLPYKDILICSWIHGSTFENYYRFKFYEKNYSERQQYLTASLRHELTRQVNERNELKFLKDKKLFSEKFLNYLGRKVFFLGDKDHQKNSTPPRDLVLKNRFGQAGSNIYFLKNVNTWDEVSDYLEKKDLNIGEWIAEEAIVQHESLMKISPNSVNTLRVITFFNGTDVDIWGVYLRMGINSQVDNMSKGGIAAYVDETGKIATNGFVKDPSIQPFQYHPVSREKIYGLQIPFYEEIISMVKKAAISIPKVRSIGWDIAITENGLCLIEGNDNWNVDIFQITRQKGLRYLAEKVCNMTLVYD